MDYVGGNGSKSTSFYKVRGVRGVVMVTVANVGLMVLESALHPRHIGPEKRDSQP
jgi:hypothetical protein